MQLRGNKYAPNFIFRKESGSFPEDLYFGFETELGIWHIDDTDLDHVIDKLVLDTDGLFYI